MILNGFAVLDVFLTLLRLILGVMVITLGLRVWRRWRATLAGEQKVVWEDRAYLLFLQAVLLLFLNIASWPLFYLLLQSYVAEFQGAMCIYGVMVIGTGSSGPSRFLPGILNTLQVLKPALLFLSGAWFVLYAINRRTATAVLMPRVLVLVILLGSVAVADAALDGAYLVIPKKEDMPATGCCTVAMDTPAGAAKLIGKAGGEEDDDLGHWAAYYIVSGGMCLGLATVNCMSRWRRGTWAFVLLGLGALTSIPVGLIFLVDIVAPTLLHLPNHHCPYDLLPAVPESMVAIILHLTGCFAVGWSCLARWWADCPQTQPWLDEVMVKIFRLALFGYFGSLTMISIELALA